MERSPIGGQLAHRTENDLRELGIELLLNHRALSIAQASRTVSVEHEGGMELLPFDRLIIATGAVSAGPVISGMEASGVYWGSKWSAGTDRKWPCTG